MQRPETLLEAEHLYKVFGRHPERALELLEKGLGKDEIFERTGQTVGILDASLAVREGEIFVVMGLSGSGKSTLLRLLNRLIEPTSGTVKIAGCDVTRMTKKELIELRRRELSMVFQSFALMPHLRVWENVAFGLEVAKMPKKQRRERAEAALDQVGLLANVNSYPAELSGGMQQRVGLARALAAEPRILLMDEAFSALDPLIRAGMQDELLALQQRQGLTVVFVSHDLDEAMRIGDRIAIMQAGQIVQIGSAEQILQHPANDYVRSFFGGVDLSNVLTARDLASVEPAIVKAEEHDLGAALDLLTDKGHEAGYVRSPDGRLLGVVSIHSLERALGSDSRELSDAYVDLEPLEADTPFDGVVRRLVEAPFPAPVVDREGHFMGTISKSKLLETLGRRKSA